MSDKKIQHSYLTDASGKPLEYIRLLDEQCGVCARGPYTPTIAVFAESPGQQTVGCIRCDFQLTRKPPNPPFRPMNSGRKT